MNNKNAVIQFVGYRVVKLLFECAAAFEFPERESSYNINFTKKCVQMSATEIQENLGVKVYYGENFENAPFKVTVEIAGRFHCEKEWQFQWEVNVLAILFPYLRSLVSGVTCNSGREPIILPTMNIANLFEVDN